MMRGRVRVLSPEFRVGSKERERDVRNVSRDVRNDSGRSLGDGGDAEAGEFEAGLLGFG